MTPTLLLMALLFAPPADEVRDTEIAFAKAFADRDAAKFFAYLNDDSIFMGPRQTMNGKAEVVKVWSEFFKDAKAPFSWKPERVVTNAAGDIGLSTGPVYDADGKHVLNFSSVWRKQKDGTWKIVFDGPGSRVCP
jgi:ketosteroid isomerase-like protein